MLNVQDISQLQKKSLKVSKDFIRNFATIFIKYVTNLFDSNFLINQYYNFNFIIKQ